MAFIRNLSLSKKFALTGSLVMLLGMFVMGLWVSNKIQVNATDNAGITTALFMDRFVAPFAQELAESDKLSIGPIRALSEMMEGPDLRNRVLLLKIWKKGGLIAYSNRLQLVGKKINSSDNLKKAWAGKVVAEFNETGGEDSIAAQLGNQPILEIYSPIRETWTGKIIAVAEFYEDASELQKKLNSVRRKSWLVVGALMMTLFVSLYGIVHRGSLLIESQRRDLQEKIRETEEFSAQNQQLKSKIERASSRYSQLNEKYLRRIGAELHDGPAQLLALASLRLDSLRKNQDLESRSKETQIIRKALDEAMTEIRNICKGLSLPEIEKETLNKVVETAVFAHQHRTGTAVKTTISLPSSLTTGPVPKAVKICVYRFLQEGLNNAYYHAGGFSQQVLCEINDDKLKVTVRDGGATNGKVEKSEKSGGLGLSGLRERVESLGGEFSFNVTKDQGCEMVMSIKLTGEKTDV